MGKGLMLVGILVLSSWPWTGQVRGQDTPRPAATRVVKVTARKYQFSPDTIEVDAGTRIQFEVTAEDREHGFEIEGSKSGCVKIKKGATAKVEYTADKAGTVAFRCCVFCGLGHRGMKGKIVIH